MKKMRNSEAGGQGKGLGVRKQADKVVTGASEAMLSDDIRDYLIAVTTALVDEKQELRNAVAEDRDARIRSRSSCLKSLQKRVILFEKFVLLEYQRLLPQTRSICFEPLPRLGFPGMCATLCFTRWALRKGCMAGSKRVLPGFQKESGWHGKRAWK